MLSSPVWVKTSNTIIIIKVKVTIEQATNAQRGLDV